jgi:hypothetical protein
MPMRCTICDHQAKNDIDRELFGTSSLRDIASRYRVGKDALARHRDNHLAARLARSIARREDMDAARLTDWLVGLNDQTLAIMMRAQQEDDLATALKAVAEVRKNMELLGRLGGFLETAPTVHVDARQQAMFSRLTDDELHRLVYGEPLTIEGTALELPEAEGA